MSQLRCPSCGAGPPGFLRKKGYRKLREASPYNPGFDLWFCNRCLFQTLIPAPDKEPEIT